MPNPKAARWTVIETRTPVVDAGYEIEDATALVYALDANHSAYVRAGTTTRTAKPADEGVQEIP